MAATALAEREVVVDTPSGPMRTFLVHPSGGGPYPVAIVYMDAPGYREALLDNARRFASAGYFVAVPDLFHRFGENVTFDMAKIREEGMEGPTIAKLIETVGALTPELVEEDTSALLAHLEGEDAAARGSKVSVGYCMGARFVVRALASRPDEFVAGAGIHPSRLYLDTPNSAHLELASIRGELHLAFADNDQNAPSDSIDAVRAEMERHGTRGTVEVRPAGHGWALQDAWSHDPAERERHFERTLEVWDRNLSAQAT